MAWNHIEEEAKPFERQREREMMNLLVSECSSGCESGWTLYFEHSMGASHPDPPFLHENRAAPFGVEAKSLGVAADGAEEKEEEEEEDLSMVSDASSGPPLLHEEEAEEEDRDRYQYNRECFLKKKYAVPVREEESVSLKVESSSKRKKEIGDHNPHFLDDTASSPLIEEFMLTDDAATPLGPVLRYSHGFSAADFKERSAFQHHFGTLQSTFSSHQFQKNQRSGSKKMSL